MPTPTAELTITTAATTNRSVAMDRLASSRTMSSPAAAAGDGDTGDVFGHLLEGRRVDAGHASPGS